MRQFLPLLPYALLGLLIIAVSQYASLRIVFLVFRMPPPPLRTFGMLVAQGFIPLVGIFVQFFSIRRIFSKNRPIGWRKAVSVFLVTFVLSATLSFITTISVRSIVSPFQVSGNAMAPTLPDKTFTLIWKYRSEYSRGDVVVFRPNAGNGKEYYVQRIIGVPGDVIRIMDGKTHLEETGKFESVQLVEPYLLGGTGAVTSVPEWSRTEFAVPPGHYFLLGDNRSHSSDSRYCFVKSCDVANSSPFIAAENVVWTPNFR